MPSKYQSIFETTLDGIIVINRVGIIEEINSAAMFLFQYQKKDVVGNNIKMLMPEPDKRRHDGYIANYHATRNPKIIGMGREVEGQKKDGSVFPFRLAVSEFTVGENTFFTGIIHDLSKQKDNEKIIREYAERLEDKVEERTLELQKEMELKAMAQKALQESQKLYVTIAENYPNGSITVLDEDYHVVFAEGSEFKSAELKATEVIGKNYFDFVPNEYKEEIENYLIEVFKGTEKIFEYEKEGKINRARCVPLSYENYKVDQILIVENNVTQEKRAEKEIYAALTKEKQLNELKTKFVSMASHEFRTPLSSILSSATLVGKYTESSQQDNRLKHLKKISKNVKNLTMILNDFLSLERIEGGLIKNNPEEIDISEFMEGVAEDAEPLLKKDQVIQLDIRVKNNIILLDIFLLRNILNNLITNAIKYSSDTITLIVEDTNGLTISVKDSGIGISEEDQVSLFNRFYRASNAGQIQGTGLGLNIVKRYVNIMGGQIIFESKLNKGSTFSIKFNE